MVNLSKIGRGRSITYHRSREVLDTEVAELLGLHAGDGYISCGVWGIRCNLQDENMAQYIIQLARNVLGVEPCVSIRENTFEIRSGQKQAVSFFQQYGFAGGKKAYIVQIPNQLASTTDSKITEAFIRGLFSSDGSFSFQSRDYSPRIDLMVRSRLLRDQFVELAAKVGFSFNKCDAKRVKKGFTQKSTGWFYNANLCSRNEVIRWMREVGSLCDTHVKKFNSWKSKIQPRIKSLYEG
jgi:intein/homing endonuclease